MRIVGGRWAGRQLTSPADARVRPTAEAVRGALLDLLTPSLRGARVLDLFAGTGALGLEALSRGAARADFVETRPASLHALRANVAALHVRERTRIFKRDAIPFAAALEADRYEVAFADPPYGSRMADRVIESWLARPYARVLAIEHDAAQELPAGGPHTTVHRFGETSVTIYRAAAAASGSIGGAPESATGGKSSPGGRASRKENRIPPDGSVGGPPGTAAGGKSSPGGRASRKENRIPPDGSVRGGAPPRGAPPAPPRPGRRGRGRGRRG